MPACPAGMPAPAQFVLDCWNTAEFFANKLLMEYRNKDETQVLWIRGAKVSCAPGPAKQLPGRAAWVLHPLHDQLAPVAQTTCQALHVRGSELAMQLQQPAGAIVVCSS